MDTNKSIGIPSLGKGKMALLGICIFLSFFITCESVVISTASASMMEDIGGNQYYSLLLSVKNMTIVVTCLVCGKLIEKVGRRNILLLGLIIQTAMNFAFGMSSSIFPILIFRALYGIGQGFTVTSSMIIIGEVFGKKSGYGYILNLAGYGLGNVTGPLIAAYLVEHYTWRWALFVLVAVSAIEFVIVLFALPNYIIREEKTAIDLKGIVFFSVSLCIIVAVLSFGGSYLAWSNPFTIVLIICGLASLVLFLRHEKMVDQNIAILPVSILRSKLVIGCAIGQLAMSINSTCLYSYIPFYMQLEMGATPTQAGMSLSIISFLTTVMGAVILSLMVKMQRHSAFGLMTVVGESIALVLIYLFLSPALSVTLMFILVTFYGLTQSVESYAFTMTAQMGLTKSKLAVGTAVLQFVRYLSGVMATAFATPVINSGTSPGAGMKTLFLIAAVITVIGAIVFGVCVPSTSKIKEAAAAAQMLEDAQLKT